MTKHKKLESDFEGMHYSILQNWLSKGQTEELPDEMVSYLEQLDHVRGMWNSNHTPQQIIKSLVSCYSDLNKRTAKSRFEDAMCYFYLESKISQKAWRNIIFEKHMQLVSAIIASAKSPDDYQKASAVLERAYKAKGLHEKEEDTIPDEAFERPNKIYSLRPEDLGLPAANKNLLSQYIDAMQIEESERVRIKQEAGIIKKNLFDDTQEED